MVNSVLKCYEFLHYIIDALPFYVRSFFWLVLGVIGLSPMVAVVKHYLLGG